MNTATIEDIQSIRELQQRRQFEDSLLAQLPQLEKEEQARLNAEQAKAATTMVQAELRRTLEDFTTAKGESDNRMKEIMIRLEAEIERQQELATWSRQITGDIVDRLAWAQFVAEKPNFNAKDAIQRADAEFRLSQLKGEALKSALPYGRLMILEVPRNLSPVGNELWQTILYLSGNVAPSNNQRVVPQAETPDYSRY